MGFKESILDDIDKVFFNTAEFAEECSWNKRSIKAIIDDDVMIRKYSSEFDALPQGSHMVFAAANQFESVPVINEVICFNGDFYTVNEIKTEMGMLTIFLSNGRG